MLSPNSVDVADSSPLGAFQFISRKKSDENQMPPMKNRKRVSAKIELGFCYLPKSSLKKAFSFSVKEETCKESYWSNATSEHPGVFHKLLKVESISVS